MKIEEMKTEIKSLSEKGKKLVDALEQASTETGVKDLGYFVSNYERWYTQTLSIVKHLIPDRCEDFIMLYKNEKRKELTYSTYTISDALRGTMSPTRNYGPSSAYTCMGRQWQMVNACYDSFDSKVKSIQIVLQADVFDSEIETAKHLCKMGFFRAAGAICGVIIEKHLAEVCKNRSLVPKKKSPTIADLNDILKDNAYDTIEWRRIQRLGDIRNLCDHNKDREPTKDEVEELISGTERITKTIF